jgi:hypothetical protein
MARKVPVRIPTPNVIRMISSEQEISLSEANRVTRVFIENMKEDYGENVSPTDNLAVFYFDVTVDENGQIISKLPTPDEIMNAKGYWSNVFQSFLRFLPR